MPTLALQGQYNRNFDESGDGVFEPRLAPDDDYNVALRLSVPVFDRNLQHLSFRSSKIQREQLRVEREDLRRRIEQGVRSALLELQNQMSNVHLSQVSEDSAVETLSLIQSAYGEGAVTVTDVIDAQNNVLQARLSRTSAVYDFLLASIVLERRIGRIRLLATPTEADAFEKRFDDFRGGFVE